MKTRINNFLADKGYWLIFAAIALVVIIGLQGCAAQSQTKHIEFDAAASASPKTAHFCKGITKKGVRCTRRVKAEGDYCWMHKDQDKR